MFGTMRSGHPGISRGGAYRRPADPLLKTIVLDLLITSGGFVLMAIAVALSVEGLP